MNKDQIILFIKYLMQDVPINEFTVSPTKELVKNPNDKERFKTNNENEQILKNHLEKQYKNKKEWNKNFKFLTSKEYCSLKNIPWDPKLDREIGDIQILDENNNVVFYIDLKISINPELPCTISKSSIDNFIGDNKYYINICQVKKYYLIIDHTNLINKINEFPGNPYRDKGYGEFIPGFRLLKWGYSCINV